MRFLVIMDPAPSMVPELDTSFALIRGAQARGHQVWHCEPRHLTASHLDLDALARSIRVDDLPPHVVLGEPEQHQVASFDAVLIRKDPPFDANYAYLTQQLDLVDDRTFVINSPRGLRDANEKLFALGFPELVPRTLVSYQPSRLLSFLDEIGGEGILKPLDGAGGAGVVRLSRTDRNARALVDLLTAEGRRPALLQEYLAEGVEGDLRVMMLDGEPLGAIRRIPRGDDIRANIHVGGTVMPAELDPAELAVVRTVGSRLREAGLWFAGLDLIAGRLIEVNVTSPTGLQQLARHRGRPLERDVVDWIERRVVLRGKS